jgi:hypothetical protein
MTLGHPGRSGRYRINQRRLVTMADLIPEEQTLSLEDLVASHSYEMIALITVLENKGILTRGEVIEVIEKLHKSRTE